jgi:hypothetical protein
MGDIPAFSLNGNTFPLPLPPGVGPAWLVPPETTSFGVTATADLPIDLNLQYGSGNPDVFGPGVGTTASASVTAAQVSPGVWFGDIGETGPFTGPAPTGTVSLAATIHTRLFDPNATTSSGDVWKDGSGPFIRLTPGQTGTITLTITPSGPVGQTVKGVLYIDTFDLFTDAGDEIAALPYSYRIG